MTLHSLTSPSLPAPSRAGRFYLTRELGRGATGCVCLAQDPVVGREVAVKILNPRLPNTERARHTRNLINEARAAGRLSHPNIVTIYEASGEDPVPYIAMEYLQGQELHRILKSGRSFKPDEVAAICWKLAEAIDHAHQMQVVHRDIKPSNIFLTSGDQPKLMDFGIARAPNRLADLSPAEEEAYTMFRPNTALGTPHYMAPEQAQGKPADARSDVYSLGAVMYEMLTGRQPFSADTPEELIELIAHKAPQALYELNPEVPPMLAQIVMKAMSKRAEKRYQEAGQLALDLKRFLARERRAQRQQSYVREHGRDDRTGARSGLGRRSPLWLFTLPAVAASVAALVFFLG